MTGRYISLLLQLYDPNLPGRDDVTLSLSTANLTRPAAITMFPLATPIHAFFRTAYERLEPP